MSMYRRSVASTKALGVRLSAEERAHVDALADADGVTPSEYMRRLVPGLAAVSRVVSAADGASEVSAADGASEVSMPKA